MFWLREVSQDESARVAALRATGVLDTPFGGPFTPLVELAARLLAAPIAYIALLDAGQLVLKAGVGLSLSEVPREWAVCEETAASGGSMMVPDARLHPKLGTHPAVTAFGIRAYAGTVLHLPDGSIAGTMCLLDTEPREFSPEQMETLRSLARMANELLKAQAQTIAVQSQAEETRRSNEARERITRYLEQAEKVGKIGHWSYEGDGSLHFSKQTYALHDLEPGCPISIKQAMNFYVPKDRDLAYRIISGALEQSSEFDFEATLVTATDRVRKIRVVGKGGRDEQGRRCVFGVIQDTTAESLQRGELRWAATHDPLTRLFNRRAFHEDGALVAARADRCVHVALLDLDHLKMVNDAHGHAAGDHLLRSMAANLSTLFPEAFVARLGGDEFGILIEGEEAEVTRRLNDLVEGLQHSGECEYGRLPLAATIGVSTVRPEDSLEAVIQRADAALYHGKQGARGTVILYRAEFERRQNLRVQQIALVKEALQGGGLKTHFQPIMDLRTNRVRGAEALVRALSDHEPISAELFQLALGDARTAARVFDVVLKDSVDLLTICPELESVSVNVAPSDLLADGFTKKVLSGLAAAGVSPTRLIIELTESTLLLGEHNRIHDLLTGLRAEGVGIALDDFGTGYSSLSHVSDFPITRLKIDKRFVQNMASRKKERAITLAIIKLAHQLGLEIVGEGIESDACRALLTSAGCELGQGYLWSPAIENFAGYFSEWSSKPAIVSRAIKA